MSDAPRRPEFEEAGMQVAPQQGAQALAQLDLTAGGGMPPPSGGGDQLGTRKPILIGSIIIAIFFGFFGFWAFFAPLDSAAIAIGTVGIEGNRRTIQHLEGGIVKEILVRDGDRVKAGQVLIRLDEIQPRAQLQLITGQRNAALALAARLRSERDGDTTITFPEALVSQGDDIGVQETMLGQLSIFQARRDAIEGQRQILRQRIGQFREEIEGLRGQNRAAIARARQSIGESEIRIVELRTEQVNEVVAELREVESQLLDLAERFRAADDVLKRIEIVSPIDGFAVDLHVFTSGGVIRPGDRLLDVVPDNEKLVIQARVSPTDIDIVHAGLDAQVRLSAFNQRITPTVDGTVSWVSADKIVDSNSGEEYYTARVELKDQNDPRLNGLTLRPGMPAEVLIRTGERTLIQYLVSPVEQSISRSLRE